MANISISKILFAVIYFLVPILCWNIPDIAALLPEAWMIACVVTAMAFIGLIFLIKNAPKAFKVLGILCIVAGLAYGGYAKYPEITKHFEEVEQQYEAESGKYYSVDNTVFQTKQQVLIEDAIGALPTAANFTWCAIGIIIVLYGLYSMKEVVAYAMIPANKSTKFNANEEIPDDVEANKNRPTAEQRAKALAQMHASSSSSSSQAAVAAAINKGYKNTEEQDVEDAMASFMRSTAGGEPVIKTSEPTVSSSSSTIQGNKRNSEPAVTHDGRVNINLDLGEEFIPKVSVEKEKSFTADDEMSGYKEDYATPKYTEPKKEEPKSEPVIIDMEEEEPAPAAANPFDNIGDIFGKPYKPPVSTPKKEAVAEPENTASDDNPFANFNDMFSKPYKPPVEAPKPAAAPEPVKVEPVKVVLTPEPEAPAPEPVKVEPVKVEPVKVEPVKVVLTPEPETVAPAPKAEPKQAPKTETASPITFKLPEGPKEAPKPVLNKANKMDPAEKARIRELNAQVAELKTLYNQGMITQEEYVSQRTELLQQMYNHS